jgi:hypothetical protein
MLPVRMSETSDWALLLSALTMNKIENRECFMLDLLNAREGILLILPAPVK